MMNCVIIDDEPLAVKLLEGYVEKTHILKLSMSFTDPIKAIHFLEQKEVDLIFLDVQMPQLSGVQFMKIINGKYPIILTTAYEDYAIDGYNFDAVDYLVKPISYERFYQSIQKAQRRSIKAQPKSQIESDQIFVKSEHKTIKIDLNEIQYLEGLSDYVAIHLAGGKRVLTLDTLKNFETLLPNDKFRRIHKSYLINLTKIDFIERQRIVITGKHIPIGATYQKSFWEYVKGKNSSS